jgi:hypothetical protein
MSMLFQLIFFLLILLATLYLSTQGIFSTLIMLACAAFASTMAMGTFEVVAVQMARWRPDYANAVALLGVFCVTFGILRLVTGFALPRNIKTTKLIDYIGGGVIGLVTSMIIFGTLMIGLGMLPTYQTILGYERYPDGIDKDPVKLWLPADDFTVGLWKLASGGAMGGNSFTAYDPEPVKTDYGYRHTVQAASRKAIDPSLVQLDKALVLKDPASITALNIPPASGATNVVVRLVVSKGTDTNTSCDDTGHDLMHTTPTQVNLVTDKQQEFFPVGYIQNGTAFKPLDPKTGSMIEDYAGDKIPQDFVFQIPDDQLPAVISYKTLSRFDISNAKAEAYAPFGGGYPLLAYLKTAPLINVEISGANGGASDVKVFLVSAGVQKRDVTAAVNTAWDGITARDSMSLINQYNNTKNAGPEESLQYDHLANMWVLGAGKEKGDDPAHYTKVMDDFVDIVKNSIHGHPMTPISTTDSAGRIPPQRLAKGSYVVIAWKVTQTEFDLWTTNISGDKDQTVKLNADAPTVQVKKP